MKSTIKSKLKNLLSRKFLIAVLTIVSGVVLVIRGQMVAGVSAIITAAIGYLVAEGYVDAKAVSSTITITDELITDLATMTDDEEIDIAAEISRKVAEEVTKQLSDEQLSTKYNASI